jgi:hypothetical protein
MNSINSSLVQKADLIYTYIFITSLHRAPVRTQTYLWSAIRFKLKAKRSIVDLAASHPPEVVIRNLCL